MSDECVAAVYDSLEKAEQAVHILRRADFPAEQISLAVSRLEENPKLVEELEMGDDSPRDAAIGAGLGGLLGVLGGISMVFAFGLGAVFLLGPIGVGLLGSAVGAFLGAMSGWGVHEKQIRHYEQCVKEGKVVVIAHGSPVELDHASRILKETDVAELHVHARNSSDSGEVSGG
jgi:hypothetical protein